MTNTTGHRSALHELLYDEMEVEELHHLPRTGEMRNGYKILDGKHEWKTPLGRFWHR